MATAVREFRLPAPQMSDGPRERLVDDLNMQLAHLMDVAASAKQAHWNLKGPNFQGLHGLFDLVAAEARTHADMVAERAVQMGGLAHGSLHAAADRTSFQPFPLDLTDWRALTGELHERVIGSATCLRESADEMDSEKATQDIYIEIIRGLEMRAWMLRAHLED